MKKKWTCLLVDILACAAFIYALIIFGGFIEAVIDGHVWAFHWTLTGE